MKTVKFGTGNREVPAVVLGCMRYAGKTPEEMNRFIHKALELDMYFFDHADIYGRGRSEEVFGEAWGKDPSLKREDMFLQTKCGIIPGTCYDLSYEHIISSVDASLKRLQTDYLDALLLHRPDPLVEPEEVARAFDELESSGKVRAFGVSNHKPMQIELLKTCVQQPLAANQLQFSIPVSNMVANGLEVNMTSPASADRDGSVLDYSRVNNMTIQTWSPFQMPDWRGCFIDSPEYGPLNEIMQELADRYGVSKTAIACAWILRHPANMQVIIGTTNETRIEDCARSADLRLTREEWYRLYLAAGHILP